MSKWRDLFYESPYVAALSNEYLQSRCSNCFAPAIRLCSKCQGLAYCNDQCRDNDRPLHQIECAARPELYSSDVRMIARFAMRQRLDGGVASLSTGFPNTVKDRTCKDLLSHYRDIKKDARRKEQLEFIWEECKKQFADSPLSKLKKSNVLRMHCILCINSFAIFENGTIDEIRPWAIIGGGLYLNASRFNHSCRADVFVQFEKSRMTVTDTNPRGDESKTWTEKEFNRLTVNYGVPSSEAKDCYVPLISQRVRSLKSRYYFKCRCVKCGDRQAKALEERASIHVCRFCEQPYVWPRRSGKLRPSCRCESNKPVKIDECQRQMLKKIDAYWEDVMARTEGENEDVVLTHCEQLEGLVKKYWHPVMNLRFGHVYERLFHAYTTRGTKDDGEISDEQRQKDTRMAISSGESLAASYELRAPNDTQIALFYCQIAMLYESLDGRQGVDKAYEWYTKAANIFRTNNDDDNESIALLWRAKLNDFGQEIESTPIADEKPIL